MQAKEKQFNKHVNILLVQDPIPSVTIYSLKGVQIVEREETTHRSGLLLIDPKAKEKDILLQET